MAGKKTFYVSEETEALWNRLWLTRGVASESEAWRQFIYKLDESVREQLDPAALGSTRAASSIVASSARRSSAISNAKRRSPRRPAWPARQTRPHESCT